MIATIADLENASAIQVEAARKSVDFKGLVRNQLKKEGQQPGRTLEQWQEHVANLQPYDCPSCRGDGVIFPHVRTVGTIHSSSATKCKAALYYDVTGEIAPEVELSIELLITFAIGHAIHAVLQKSLHATMEDRFEDEVRVNVPEALICDGSADGIGYFSKCRSGLEIKTISEKEYAKLRKPKKDHLIQAGGLYSTGLDLPFMSYLYVSKGWPHDMKEYVLPYDRGVFDTWYQEKCIFVENGLEEEKPPKADASAYECKNCGYRKDCPQSIGMRDRFRTG